MQGGHDPTDQVVPLFVGGQGNSFGIQQFIHMLEIQFGQITKGARSMLRTGTIRLGFPDILTSHQPFVGILELRITGLARQRDTRCIPVLPEPVTQRSMAGCVSACNFDPLGGVIGVQF